MKEGKVRKSGWRRLRIDEHARVPFAFVAVIILLMAGFSWAYLSAVNKDEILSKIENKEIQRMDAISDTVQAEVTTHAYALSLDVIRQATQFDVRSEDDINNLFANESKNGPFDLFISETYPRIEGEYEITIWDYSATISLRERQVRDLASETLVEDEVPRSGGESVEMLNMTKGKSVMNTSAIAYYNIQGYLNITITKSGTGYALNKTVALDKEIKCPYPFLDNKFKALQSNADGDMTEIGRMTKYILTTIAQYRVLQGYGMCQIDNSGQHSTVEGVGTAGAPLDEIITAQDVEIATNLAVQLEIARLYRTYDSETTPHFEAYADYSQMSDLIDTYVNNDTIDAADLFAIFYGADDPANELNLEGIIAQGLNAIADQFILKFMDFFGFMDIADGIFVGVQYVQKAIEEAGNAVDDFFNWLIGTDTNKGKNLVLEHLNKLFSDASLDYYKSGDNIYLLKEPLDDTYDYQNSEAGWPSIDIDISGDEFIVKLVARGQPHDETVPVTHYWDEWEQTGVDGDGNPVFGWVQHSAVENVLLSPSYYDRIVYTVHVRIAGHPDEKIAFSPQEITGHDSLWRSYYSDQFEVDANEVYTSIRDATKEIISQVVGRITSAGSLRDDLNEHRTVDINPNDDIALLETIQQEVNGAIDDIVAFYQGSEGEEEIKQIINDILSPDGENTALELLAENLVQHLNINYDELVNCDSTPNYLDYSSNHPMVEACKPLAHRLTDNGIDLDSSTSVDSVISGQFDFFNAYPNYDTGTSPTPNHNLARYLNEETDYDYVVTPSSSGVADSVLIERARTILNQQVANDYSVLKTQNHHITDVMDSLSYFIQIAYDEVKVYELNLLDEDDAKYTMGYVRTGSYSVGEINPLMEDRTTTFTIHNQPPGIISESVYTYLEGGYSEGSQRSQILDLLVGGAVDILQGSGLIPLAGEFVKTTCSDIIFSGKVANTKFIQDVRLKEPGSREFLPFEFRGNGTEIGADLERLAVNQTPDWLDLSDGLSKIEISDKQFGTHYTNVVEFSTRPFETQWNVSIEGQFDLSTRTLGKVFLVNGTHYETWRNGTVNLSMTIPVTVYSGWELAGVDYNLTDENNLLTAFMDCLYDIWDNICDIGNWIVDGVFKVVELFTDLVQKLIEEGAKLSEVMYEALQVLNQTIGYVANKFASVVSNAILGFLNALGQNHWEFSLFGFTLIIWRDGGQTFIELSRSIGDFGDFNSKTRIAPFDVQTHIDLDIWELELDVEIDPLLPYQSLTGDYIDSPLHLEGNWDDIIGIRLDILKVEQFAGFHIKQPVPCAPLVFEIGVKFGGTIELLNTATQITLLLNDVLGQGITEAFGNQPGETAEEQDIFTLVRNVESLYQYIWESKLWEELANIIDDTLETFIEFYVKVGIGGSAGAVGAVNVEVSAGVEFSVVITDPINTLQHFLKWLINDIEGILTVLFSRAPLIIAGALSPGMQILMIEPVLAILERSPVEAQEHLHLKITLVGTVGGQVVIGAEGQAGGMVRFNTPFMLAMTLKERNGKMKTEFGVFDKVKISLSILATSTTLWGLKGELYEI